MASAGRRPGSEHLGEARRGLRRELGLRRRPRRAHGRQDAAARRRDLRVGRAGQPPAQLVAPVAGEHHVRVRHRRTRARATGPGRRSRVVVGVTVTARRTSAVGPTATIVGALARDRAVGDRSVIALPRSGTWRGPGHRPELVEVFDEQGDGPGLSLSKGPALSLSKGHA